MKAFITFVLLLCGLQAEDIRPGVAQSVEVQGKRISVGDAWAATVASVGDVKVLQRPAKFSADKGVREAQRLIDAGAVDARSKTMAQITGAVIDACGEACYTAAVEKRTGGRLVVRLTGVGPSIEGMKVAVIVVDVK